MNIIIVPEISDIKDDLELEEIKEAVADEDRYEGENASGSYTFWVYPVFTDRLPLSHGTSPQSNFFVL